MTNKAATVTIMWRHVSAIFLDDDIDLY